MKPLAPIRIFALALTTLSVACGPSEPSPVATADAGSDARVRVDAGEGDPDVATPLDTASPDAAPDAPPDQPSSIFEPGPYNVGYRKMEFTYDARGEADRTIKLVAWYPTEDTEGEPANYLLSYKRQEAFTDASVALRGEAPLLVFSHGNTSLAEQSFFMTEFWASHGWVVIAPYHTGNTIYEAGGGVNLRSAPLRPQDITASMDFIYGLPTEDPLHGKIGDDVVMTGHSFGGFTTLAVAGTGFAVDEVIEHCAQPGAPSECEILDEPGLVDNFRAGFLDPRIDVAIPQTPGGFLFFQTGLADIEIPTLLLTGRRDATLTDAAEGDPIWAGLTGPHVRVDVINAGHFTFSNMCVLLPGVPQVANDGCADDFIEAPLAFELINAHSLAFARFHLYGDTSNLGLFDGTDTRYAAEVEIEQKRNALPTSAP